MINVTVIKGKDIIKYTIKMCILMAFIFIFQKILKESKDKTIGISEIFNEDKLLACMEENIPVISQIEGNEEPLEEKIGNVNLFEKIIEREFQIAKFIKPKEEKENKIQEELTKENKTETINETTNEIEHAKTGLSTQVIQNNVPNKYTNAYKGVQVKNETNYGLTEEMLTPNIEVNNKKIVIFHTHTCESYTPSEKFQYEQTGTYRTTDLNFSVARVGNELTSQLTSYGYNVIHNTTYHDWPSYSGSYGRSLTTVENILKENQNTDVVIDLHRDAIGDYSYAPTVKIGDEEAAQIMFVMGTDGGGLEHPNWSQNLKFAIKIQEKANEMYPGLFKPIILRNSRYNQHLSKAACIIEVGATGNTMDQCLNSMKYLAKVISEVLK